MRLSHTFYRELLVDKHLLLKCMSDMNNWIVSDKYIKNLSFIEEDKYSLNLYWNRLSSKIRVKTTETSFTIEPYDGDYFHLVIWFREKDDGITEIHVTGEAETGFFSRLMGKKRFVSFIESLIDDILFNCLKKIHLVYAGEKNIWINCNKCLFFERITRKCYLLGKTVVPSQVPECNGNINGLLMNNE